jgi:hypothetical protein
LYGLAIEVREFDTTGREDSDVAVVEEEHVSRVAEDSGNVGGDEELAITQADYHWRA